MHTTYMYILQTYLDANTISGILLSIFVVQFRVCSGITWI